MRQYGGFFKAENTKLGENVFLGNGGVGRW